MKKTITILSAILVLGLAGCQTVCDPNQPDCDGQGRGSTDPTVSSKAICDSPNDPACEGRVSADTMDECDPDQPDCDGQGRGSTDPT